MTCTVLDTGALVFGSVGYLMTYGGLPVLRRRLPTGGPQKNLSRGVLALYLRGA